MWQELDSAKPGEVYHNGWTVRLIAVVGGGPGCIMQGASCRVHHALRQYPVMARARFCLVCLHTPCPFRGCRAMCPEVGNA